jgi:hypothetical protein
MTLGFGEGRSIDQDAILRSIVNVITEVEESAREPNSEIPPPQFEATKTKCVFILERMHILLTYMRFRGEEISVMETDTQRYKREQQPFRWLNLFNGSLFDDIIRVIAVGHLTGLHTLPNIAELYYLFNGRVNMQDGGNASKPDNRIMSGGAKMVLSSFREYREDRKDDLVRMITAWNELQQEQPPDDQLYLAFYYGMLDPRGVNRNLDSRLVRKIHPERFGEMKQMIKRLRDRDHYRGETQLRFSRFVEQLLADTRTYKDVIDSFMEQVKSDFDSLIAEDELAREAAQAAEAARPIRGDQRQAVYKMSHLIAKKGLQYADVEFGNIADLIRSNGLHSETLRLLPNLVRFLPIAQAYVRRILSNAPPPPDPRTLQLIDGLQIRDYMETDKYETLLFQLFLLGLIYQHGRNGNQGGLPDIDSRLAASMVQKLGSHNHRERYLDDGYVYLDHDESQQLFEYISQHNDRYIVMDNGIPSGIKQYLGPCTVCNIPSRADPAAGFGGCTQNNQDFDSMIMFVTDLEERNIYFTKHIYDPDSNTVTIVYSIILGNGIVIANTVPDIDLTKAPTVLSANRVMKDGIREMINIWKSNTARTPADLWASLEDDQNFVRVMKEVTKKGHGDADQENSALAPNAGFEDARRARQQKWLKHLLFGAGDRPSIARGIGDMKFAVNRAELFHKGRSIMSYTNETNSFTLAHKDCLPDNLIPQGQQVQVQRSAKRRKRDSSRAAGGSLKFSRRYTRKKSRARR